MFQGSVLVGVVIFIGWWGQGQLSIVTPLAVLRTTIDQGNFGFLLYDPFSLVIWSFTILGLFLWGRGYFCGWLCPFGAFQEVANWLGKALGLRQIHINDTWDSRLKYLKYIILLGLVAVTIIAPQHIDTAAEVEPFKTAITVYFVREFHYVAYAVFWLLLSMVLFKGFCRYICPLGAFLALGSLVRRREWIDRRVECGSPCQLCKVKCNYNAIKKSGEVVYSECFQYLDCVTIYERPDQCVPLILANKHKSRNMDSAS